MPVQYKINLATTSSHWRKKKKKKKNKNQNAQYGIWQRAFGLKCGTHFEADVPQVLLVEYRNTKPQTSRISSSARIIPESYQNFATGMHRHRTKQQLSRTHIPFRLRSLHTQNETKINKSEQAHRFLRFLHPSWAALLQLPQRCT